MQDAARPQTHAASSANALPGARLPVTIVGGYLGAGKTTLINHLLRHAGGRRLAIVVNDFGDIAIDADLIEARSADTISIAGGCVCCSIGSDLLQTLERLRGAPVAFDQVLIETSGVALPRSVRAAVSLAAGFDVAATIVLADAATIVRQACDRYVGDTVLAQLAAADLLVLTKCDLVAADPPEALERWLEENGVVAPVLRAVEGRLPPEILLGEAAPERPPNARPDVLRAFAHRGAEYDTEAFAVERGVDARQLAAALAAHCPPLVRAKGVVPSHDGSMQVIQLVGRQWRVGPAAAGVAGPGRLVAIAAGSKIDRAAIRAAIADATVG